MPSHESKNITCVIVVYDEPVVHVVFLMIHIEDNISFVKKAINFQNAFKLERGDG